MSVLPVQEPIPPLPVRHGEEIVVVVLVVVVERMAQEGEKEEVEADGIVAEDADLVRAPHALLLHHPMMVEAAEAIGIAAVKVVVVVLVVVGVGVP